MISYLTSTPCLFLTLKIPLGPTGRRGGWGMEICRGEGGGGKMAGTENQETKAYTRTKHFAGGWLSSPSAQVK